MKNGMFFNMHGTNGSFGELIFLTKEDTGSMDSDLTLDSIGLPHDMDVVTLEKVVESYMTKLTEIDSKYMQHRA